jgi:hypothetical protein
LSTPRFAPISNWRGAIYRQANDAMKLNQSISPLRTILLVFFMDFRRVSGYLGHLPSD